MGGVDEGDRLGVGLGRFEADRGRALGRAVEGHGAVRAALDPHPFPMADWSPLPSRPEPIISPPRVSVQHSSVQPPSSRRCSQQPDRKAGMGTVGGGGFGEHAGMRSSVRSPRFGGEATLARKRRRSEFVGGAHQLGQAGRGHRQPAALEPVGDMVPIDARPVELDPDPVGRAVIGGAEIEFGLGLDQLGHFVLAAAFDQHADRFLAMVAVPHDGEEFAAALAADLPAGRAVAGLEAGFGQGQGEFADLAGDPVEIAGAAEILAEDARVELVLGDQHALGERCGRVVRAAPRPRPGRGFRRYRGRA